MLYVLVKKAIIIIISKTVFFPFLCYLCRSLEASSWTTIKPWFHGNLQLLCSLKSWDTQWYFLPSMPSIQIRSKYIDIHNCIGLMRVFIWYDAWRAVTKCGLRALVLSKLNYCNSLLYGTTSQKINHVLLVLNELQWLPISKTVELDNVTLAYKALHDEHCKSRKLCLQCCSTRTWNSLLHSNQSAVNTYRLIKKNS